MTTMPLKMTKVKATPQFCLSGSNRLALSAFFHKRLLTIEMTMHRARPQLCTRNLKTSNGETFRA